MNPERRGRQWETLTIQPVRSGVEGVGDAHSSVDTRDNITLEERRGITYEEDSANKRTIKLVKYSNQEKIQAEIASLSQKKRRERNWEDKLRLFQLKLYDKAKQENLYCFYVLYDKVFQEHTLNAAYNRVRSNGGSPGVDKQSFKDIEAYGIARFLKELGEDLRKRTYKPMAVKRVWIPKSNGGKRPLGIPTIRDRVAQTACKLVIEPIYEADFAEESYGFRPKRNAHGAMKQIKAHLKSGKTAVYDADLRKYFDTIPHDKLMIALKERISDTRILTLITQWLKAPVVESGRYTGGRKSKEGTPQGGVISPLLANIYLHLFDRIVSRPKGRYAQWGMRLVRYADDFVLMAPRITEKMLDDVVGLLNRMGLQINEEKSRVLDARKQPFDFLGLTVRYDRSIFGKGRFWHISPSKRSRKKVRENVNNRLKLIGHFPPTMVVKELNPILRGWINYFRMEGVSQMQIPLKELDDYLNRRIERYYHRKSQRKCSLHGQQAYEMLVKEYGLYKPYTTSGIRPVNAMLRTSLEKAVCGKTARTV